MNQDDEQLSNLLGNWRGIEPSAGFELRVHRRIHETPRKATWLEWFQPVPALSALAALAVAALIGFSTPSRSTTAGVLERGTISGNYILLASGEMK